MDQIYVYNPSRYFTYQKKKKKMILPRNTQIQKYLFNGRNHKLKRHISLLNRELSTIILASSPAQIPSHAQMIKHLSNDHMEDRRKIASSILFVLISVRIKYAFLKLKCFFQIKILHISSTSEVNHQFKLLHVLKQFYQSFCQVIK